MGDDYSWLGWLVICVAAGALVEILDTHSLSSLSSVSEAHALSLPHRVQFTGFIERLHLSGESLVFDVKNNGVITCYFRHPPSSLFVFPHDYFSIRATLVLTSRGRLCIVESMKNVSMERDSNAS